MCTSHKKVCIFVTNKVSLDTVSSNDQGKFFYDDNYNTWASYLCHQPSYNKFSPVLSPSIKS